LLIVLYVLSEQINAFLYLHPMRGNIKILSYKDQTEYGKGSIIPHSWASHENRFNARSKPFIASIRRKGPICCWLQLQDSVTDCLEIVIIRQTDRQTSRKTDRQANKQRNRQTDKQTGDRKTDKQTETHSQAGRQTDR
jgi:hypothetical protein